MLWPILSKFGRFSRKRHRGTHHLTRRNIYVLPTKAGIAFAAVVLVMLCTSINYQLPLGYGLTFWAAGIALIGAFHCVRNLSSLSLEAERNNPVFLGETAQFRFAARNATRLSRLGLRVYLKGMTEEHDFLLPANSEQTVTVSLPTTHRGWTFPPRLRIRTLYPLGLWQAWSYWLADERFLVYPAPESPGVPLPQKTAHARGAGAFSTDQQDLSSLRAYVPGDAPRHIAWKAMARNNAQTLLTKQFEVRESGELILDWQKLPQHLTTEQRLSRLTRWVLEADKKGIRYGLKLPEMRLPPQNDPTHCAQCLEALATFHLQDPPHQKHVPKKWGRGRRPKTPRNAVYAP